MPRKRYDRSKWGEGPWEGEDDRVEFEHAGLKCLVLRGPMGSWCGYVAVPMDHPWYRQWYGGCTKGCDPKPPVDPKEYEIQEGDSESIISWKKIMQKEPPSMRIWRDEHPSCEEYSHSPDGIISVHGGLTYAGPNNDDPEFIGRKDALLQWWFGFDCAHAGDLVPEMEMQRRPGGVLAEVAEKFKDLDRGEVYRTQKYVIKETKRLAKQLAKVEK